MADLEQIVNQLSDLTVIEAAELSKLLEEKWGVCLLYTSPSPRDLSTSRMPSSA